MSDKNIKEKKEHVDAEKNGPIMPLKSEPVKPTSSIETFSFHGKGSNNYKSDK